MYDFILQHTFLVSVTLPRLLSEIHHVTSLMSSVQGVQDSNSWQGTKKIKIKQNTIKLKKKKIRSFCTNSIHLKGGAASIRNYAQTSLQGTAANCFTNLVWHVWIACWWLPTRLNEDSLDAKASDLALGRIIQSQWGFLAQKKHFMNARVLSRGWAELCKQYRYT